MNLPKLHPLSYHARITIYHLWQAGSALVIAYGVAIPHAQLWEQLVIVLLGLGYGSAAHVALKHIHPMPKPGGVVGETPPDPRTEIADQPAGAPASALEALERAVRRAQR